MLCVEKIISDIHGQAGKTSSCKTLTWARLERLSGSSLPAQAASVNPAPRSRFSGSRNDTPALLNRVMV